MNKTLWLLLAHPLLFSTYTITEADSLGWDCYADIQEKYFSLSILISTQMLAQKVMKISG